MSNLKLVPTPPSGNARLGEQSREAPNPPSSGGQQVACGGVERPYLVLRVIATSAKKAEPALPDSK